MTFLVKTTVLVEFKGLTIFSTKRVVCCILRSGGRGGQKRPKIAVTLKYAPIRMIRQDSKKFKNFAQGCDEMKSISCNFCRYNGTGTLASWVQFCFIKFHLFGNGTSSVPVPSKLKLVPDLELGTSSSVTQHHWHKYSLCGQNFVSGRD